MTIGNVLWYHMGVVQLFGSRACHREYSHWDPKQSSLNLENLPLQVLKTLWSAGTSSSVDLGFPDMAFSEGIPTNPGTRTIMWRATSFGPGGATTRVQFRWKTSRGLE